MMKRRDLSLALAGMAAGSVLPSLAHAQGQSFRAGQDYRALERPASVETPRGKIEVVEFFSYMCPHCNAFEPAFEVWSKRVPKDVVVRRAPVAFLPDFAVLQRLYFTLEAMGLVDKLHAKVFVAIHVERRRFSKPETAADWAAQQGVDRTRFLEQFNSFTVASKVTRATQLMSDYQVEGVPALGVAGRFYTDGTMARTMDRTLQVVDYLVGEVRHGR
jgi:thiol:disulfide interchange protein DsbA